MLAFSFSWLYFLSVSYSFYRLFQSVSLLSPRFWDWAPTWDPSLTHALHTHVSVNMYTDTRAQRANYTRPPLKPLITCVHMNNQSTPRKSWECFPVLLAEVNLSPFCSSAMYFLDLSWSAHTVFPDTCKSRADQDVGSSVMQVSIAVTKCLRISTHRRESLFGL